MLYSRIVPALAGLLTLGAMAVRAQDGEPVRIDFGFEQRVRNENWNNIIDYNDKTDDQRIQVRYRTRLWSTFHLSSKVDFNVGLDQETNEIIYPTTPFKFDEIIFESLYLDFHDILAKGLSLRVGRQNFIKDDGWLALEGNPYDGSRSIYVNAFDLGYAFGKSKVEAIGILDPSHDRFLPIINDKNRELIEWDEQAIGGYFTHKPRKDTDIEAYYFLKKEIHDRRPPTNPQYQPDRHVSTAGGRFVRRYGSGSRWVTEGAEQWGTDHAQRDIRGWGLYSYVKKGFQAPMSPYLQGGWYGFSGDDATTKSTYEGWDPLFSRWPAWSELYIYSQFKEKGVAYWTNLSMWQAETGFRPIKPLDWRFTYYRMDAFHPYAGSAAIFGHGTGRGDMLQSRLGFTLNPQWSGHVLYEAMLPGSFYSHHDTGWFLRFEMIYAFKHTFELR